MSEFEKFATIPQQEIDEAVRLSELVLPAESQPVIGDDGSLHVDRTFNGQLHNSDEAVFTFITRDSSDDGTDKLVAAKVSERFSDGAVKSTLYTLVLNNGRFVVQSDIDSAKNILQNKDSQVNPHAEVERDILQFDLGLMAPDANDWDDFKKLLETPTNTMKAKPETEAGPVAKASRLARIFGWLRKK